MIKVTEKEINDAIEFAKSRLDKKYSINKLQRRLRIYIDTVFLEGLTRR